MATDLSDDLDAGAFVRTLTINIFDSSAADIILNYGQLTGGSWVGAAPQPGAVIQPGQTTYGNGAENGFTSLGGSILLTPASGGTITISWSWPNGSGVSGTTTGTSLNGLGVSSTVVNTQTNNPQMQVYITNSAALEALFNG